METIGFGKDIPPTKEHVIIYFIQKGCVAQNALNFYSYFSEKNWKNNRGNLLSNWKRAAWEWILNRNNR